MSKKSKLVIDPGKEIHFEGSVQPPGPKPASLDLRNPNSDKRIAFKLRTLDPSRYVVTPRIGILEPGSEVTVNIRFKAVQNMNSYQPDRQRFLVQAMIVQDDKLTPEQCVITMNITINHNFQDKTNKIVFLFTNSFKRHNHEPLVPAS